MQRQWARRAPPWYSFTILGTAYVKALLVRSLIPRPGSSFLLSLNYSLLVRSAAPMFCRCLTAPAIKLAGFLNQTLRYQSRILTALLPSPRHNIARSTSRDSPGTTGASSGPRPTPKTVHWSYRTIISPAGVNLETMVSIIFRRRVTCSWTSKTRSKSQSPSQTR